MSESYDIIALEVYASDCLISSRVLAPSNSTRVVEPLFFRNRELCEIAGYDTPPPSPEVRLYELNEVTVMGRTEFILKDGLCLYPQIIDPCKEAFMMEIEKRGSINIPESKIKIFPRGHVLKTDSAISLLGQCNGNYAHWITEVLTRLVLIDDLAEFKGWPILVDSPVHEKLLDMLDFLNCSRRTVISVASYQKVHVKNLAYITPPCMTPPETRKFFEEGVIDRPRSDQFKFSSVALARLKDKAISKSLECVVHPRFEEPWCEELLYPAKLHFFSRQAKNTGNGRFLENTDAVEIQLKEFGFSAIELADFSFQGQVLTAFESGIVVAPIGASLVNLVFSRPGCIVVILSPHYEGATFFYFANLMSVLGHQSIFVLGSQTRHGDNSIYNKNFHISLPLLRAGLLKAMELYRQKKMNLQKQ